MRTETFHLLDARKENRVAQDLIGIGKNWEVVIIVRRKPNFVL